MQRFIKVRKLIEVGFSYVCDINDAEMFRKQE